LPRKLEALEAQDVYKKRKQKSDRQDANRRPQYNPQGERTGRTRLDSMQVQNIQYEDGSNYNRQLYFPRHSLYKISLFATGFHFVILSSVTCTSFS